MSSKIVVGVFGVSLPLAASLQIHADAAKTDPDAEDITDLFLQSQQFMPHQLQQAPEQNQQLPHQPQQPRRPSGQLAHQLQQAKKLLRAADGLSAQPSVCTRFLENNELP